MFERISTSKVESYQQSFSKFSKPTDLQEGLQVLMKQIFFQPVQEEAHFQEVSYRLLEHMFFTFSFL